MSTETGTWGGELSALESRADVDSLEDLQQRRRELIAKNATLIARYGNFGLHDDFRKNFVECQKLRARMDLTKEGAKVTEGAVDNVAYGGDAYAAFLDNALTEKAEWVKIDNEINELNERIQHREVALRAYTAECRLT
jgi:hypothetical protein